MSDLNDVVATIRGKREGVSSERSVLVGISGIDGSGKGYVSQQIQARLAQCSIPTALINIDGWLSLPNTRFSDIEPAKHFYENAIRFDDLFSQLVLPLRNQRSICLIADFTEETAVNFRKHTYSFEDVDVILLEGIFLFRREFRELYDIRVWIDCSYWTALSRALERKQEGLPPAATVRAYETIYFPAQRMHMELDKPRAAAEIIITNDPFLETPAYGASFVRSGSLRRLTA